METLNADCLEHIFRFLDNHPKEWAELSKVSKQWEEVISNVWKKIDRISFSKMDYYQTRIGNRLTLSTESLIDIVKYAAEHVRTVEITERNPKAVGIGNYIYKLDSFDVDQFLETISQFSGNIAEASFYPENRFVEHLMRPNPTLEKLSLFLDEQCTSWTRFEIIPVEHLELRRLDQCKLSLRSVWQSFPPDYKKLTLQFYQSASDSETVEDILLFPENFESALEELTVNVNEYQRDHCFAAISGQLFSRQNCNKMLKKCPNLRVLKLVGIDTSDSLDLMLSLTNLEKLSIEINPVDCLKSLRTVKTTDLPMLNKLTSFTLRLNDRYGDRNYRRRVCLMNRDDNMFGNLINKMPSLKRLKVCTTSIRGYYFDREGVKNPLMHALNLGISQNRKIVVNDYVTVVSNDKVDDAKDLEVLSITMPYMMEELSIDDLIKEYLKNCSMLRNYSSRRC